MSWWSSKISKSHRDIYSKAFNAIYEDAKSVSSDLLETTGTLLSSGYEKVKDGVTYLDKKYHEDNDNPLMSGKTPEPKSDMSDINSSDTSDSDICYENVPVSKSGSDITIQPDVLVKLNKKNRYLSKIWIMDDPYHKTLVKGPIAGYPYVNTIIHRWFEYENCNGKWKWYPRNELYTKYRESTPRQLNPIDMVLFRYTGSGYLPCPYHPLF